MKKQELRLHKLANEEVLSRELINLSYDAQADTYRAIVKVASPGTTLQTYLYCKKEDLNEEQVCRIILALAVAYYLGEDIVKVREGLIAETKEPNKKRGSRKATPAKEEEESKEGEPEDKAAEPVEAEDSGAEKPKAKSPKAKDSGEKKTKEKPKAKPKTIPYDRNQAEHKKELAKVLNANFPTWAKDKELAAKAKSASETLVGVALFDTKGNVLSTFADDVIELMSDEENVSL